MNQGDEICVYFLREDSAPYRMHGRFIKEDDENCLIEGTVGEYIHKMFIVPKRNIKMIEIIFRKN